jgi:hypothetical protein
MNKSTAMSEPVYNPGPHEIRDTIVALAILFAAGALLGVLWAILSDMAG